MIGGPDQKAESYRMRLEALKLRRLGKTWDEVAEGAGYANRSNAYNAVKALMKERQTLAYRETDLYVQESLDRLEALLTAAMPRAMNGDEKMMREARLIIRQISELRGENAPVKVEIGESDVDRLLRDAIDEFRRRTGIPDSQAGAIQAGPRPDGGAESV